MERTVYYRRVRFSVEALRAAMAAMPTEPDETLSFTSRDVGEWSFDDTEEFFADYARQPTAHATLSFSKWCENKPRVAFWLHYENGRTAFRITAGSRPAIEKVFNTLESFVEGCRLPEPPKPPKPKPVVFIGHGRSTAWRDLSDHLRDQHGYDVQAYETGARAGHAIRDILQDLVSTSTFAVLVMTGEDEMADHTLRPRENVVHEAGLFQGALGFARAVVAVEDGVEPFSNLQGIQWLPFPKGGIRSIFGDVLATLRREFGEDD